MFRFRLGLARQLQWLAVINALAFLLITLIVGLAFERVESLSSDVARHEVAGVIDNASLGRDISGAFLEIDLISRSCHGEGALEGSGKRLFGRLERIARGTQDKELAQAVTLLSSSTTELLEACTLIKGIRADILHIDGQVQAELSALENLIGRALISQTLAGKTTDHLDQIMTLVIGYRESALLIGAKIARVSANNSIGGSPSVLALIDDLSLRLQTLTASPPDIARAGRRLIGQVAAYRDKARRLEISNARFNTALAKNHGARESLLASMGQLDQGSSTRIEGAAAEIRQIVKASRQRVLGLSLFVALFTLGIILWTVRRSIREPLGLVIEQIKTIQSGNTPMAPVLRQDEWGDIQASLAHMSGELAASRYLLQKVIDTAPIRVFWKDSALRYLGCNPAFAQDAGKSSVSEVVGKDDYAMGWTDQADLYRADDRQIIDSGVPKLLYEEVQTTPEGVSIWLRTSKVPLRNQDNRIIGVLGIYEDITAQKQAEAELEQYRRHLEELVQERTTALLQTEAKASLILQSSADGLYGVDREGLITFINPAACQLLGYSAESVVGCSAHGVFHHHHPDGSPYPLETCPSHAAICRGREVRVDDEVYWHADGHAVPVMFAVHPLILNGENSGAVISFVDMSEQRAASLAREKALLAAENLARARSEFLSNMSHEIRTPINGVLGFAEIGYRNYQNSEKAKNAFDKILSSGKRLLGVINDILDFSKIEAGKLNVEKTTVLLQEVIEQDVGIVRELALAKGLELRIELDPGLPESCIGDPLRISQVLLNLLSNAVKFTELGRVTLSAACREESLIFRVTDTGIGMDEAVRRHLFEPFQQGDGSTSRRFGGTGLGLSIAKRIAELMGGSIDAESTCGRGSSFEFRLPYVAVLAPEPLPATVHRAQPEDKPLAGIRILAVEDEPINQMILEENLIEDGATVVMAGNGREAVERIFRDGRQAYDVVLMDIQMPEMDGFEATRRILERMPDLPVIGQTAHAFEEERQRCFAAGMVAHIAKPIDPVALSRLVLLYAVKPASKS